MFLLSPIYILAYRARITLIAGLSSLFLFSPAYATDIVDISIGLKTWPFINNRQSGSLVIAVVFDTASPESRADAEAIKNDIDGKATVLESLSVTAKLVGISDIASLQGSDIAFLAKDIPPQNFDAINGITASHHILTMSTDLECVKANKCILGIVSKPRVAIYYSPQAAEASHISFAQSFIMLVRRI